MCLCLDTGIMNIVGSCVMCGYFIIAPGNTSRKMSPDTNEP